MPPLPPPSLFTHSGSRCFHTCARKYQFRYVERFRTVRTSDALRIGTLIHLGLEQWWTILSAWEQDEGPTPLESALGAVKGKAADPFEQARVDAMLLGYDIAWNRTSREQFEVLAVEHQFDFPLRSPDFKHRSRQWREAGKVDLILRDRRTGRMVVGEHKTTSDSVYRDDSDYWAALTLDQQISKYLLGCMAAGFGEADEILYDVIRKPQEEPYKATPPEARKYTKQGALYANQRDTDETAADYFQRIQTGMIDRPERYFQRKRIPRTMSQLHDYMREAWQTAQLMSAAKRTGAFPQNPDACFNMGRCEYWNACASGNHPRDLADQFYYEEQENPELGAV